MKVSMERDDGRWTMDDGRRNCQLGSVWTFSKTWTDLEAIEKEREKELQDIIGEVVKMCFLELAYHAQELFLLNPVSSQLTALLCFSIKLPWSLTWLERTFLSLPTNKICQLALPFNKIAQRGDK